MRTLILLMCLVFSGLIHAQTGTTVTLKFDQFKTDQGQLVVGMYQKDNFLRAKPEFGEVVPIKNAIAKVVFKNVPEGVYAVSCFQDKNSNFKLDRLAHGMPAEPYGFSNNPVLNGPPQFENAKFSVGEKPLKKEIHMVQ